MFWILQSMLNMKHPFGLKSEGKKKNNLLLVNNKKPIAEEKKKIILHLSIL